MNHLSEKHPDVASTAILSEGQAARSLPSKLTKMVEKAP